MAAAVVLRTPERQMTITGCSRWGSSSAARAVSSRSGMSVAPAMCPSSPLHSAGSRTSSKKGAPLRCSREQRCAAWPPGWNNAPRYGERFTALADVPAAAFGELLRAPSRSDLPLLINAWNEWSEGAAIEPCAYLGTRYLDALGSAPDGAPLPFDAQAIEAL